MGGWGFLGQTHYGTLLSLVPTRNYYKNMFILFSICKRIKTTYLDEFGSVFTMVKAFYGERYWFH